MILICLKDLRVWYKEVNKLKNKNKEEEFKV